MICLKCMKRLRGVGIFRDVLGHENVLITSVMLCDRNDALCPYNIWTIDLSLFGLCHVITKHDHMTLFATWLICIYLICIISLRRHVILTHRHDHFYNLDVGGKNSSVKMTSFCVDWNYIQLVLEPTGVPVTGVPAI